MSDLDRVLLAELNIRNYIAKCMFLYPKETEHFLHSDLVRHRGKLMDIRHAATRTRAITIQPTPDQSEKLVELALQTGTLKPAQKRKAGQDLLTQEPFYSDQRYASVSMTKMLSKAWRDNFRKTATTVEV